MERKDARKGTNARERLIEAAYALFAAEGIARVGVDRILSESGCAKASLYYNFGSKDDLALAFLDRRHEVWTRGWLEAETTKRAARAEDRLLAIFDVFDDWFRSEDFEGCSFVNTLLESVADSPLHKAAADYLAKIREIMCGWAEAAGLADPESFAQGWHMMMTGSIIAAGEGNRDAAQEARRCAAHVLERWPRL